MSKKLLAELRSLLQDCDEPDREYASAMHEVLVHMMLENAVSLLAVAENGNRRLLADYIAAKQYGDDQGAYARWLEIKASGALARTLSGKGPSSDEDYLTVSETASILRVSTDVVRDAINGGKLKASTVGQGLQRQTYIIQRLAIAEYVADNAVKARKPRGAPRKVADRKKWDL